MKRDFTDSAKQELMGLIDQVEDEKWFDATDWIGDRFLDLRGLVGELSIDNYLSNINEYHKLIIDKNNTSKKRIESIFDEVYAVDSTFVSRFAACQVRLANYTRLVQAVADTINPARGLGAADFTVALDGLFEQYDEQDAALKEIASSDDGISEETLERMSQGNRKNLLDRIASVVIDSLPDIGVDGEVEIPLGVGMTLYYSVKGSYDNASDAEIDASIKDGRLRLKGFKASKEAGDSSIEYSESEGKKGMNVTIGQGGNSVSGEIKSDGSTSTSVKAGNGQVDIDMEGVTYTYSFDHDGATYVYKDGVSFEKCYVEESVKVKTGDGTTTSTVGIKSSNNSNGRWTPVPEPVPVEVPHPVSIPSFPSPDWETVGPIIIIGGIIVYAGLTIATGGATAPLIVFA